MSSVRAAGAHSGTLIGGTSRRLGLSSVQTYSNILLFRLLHETAKTATMSKFGSKGQSLTFNIAHRQESRLYLLKWTSKGTNLSPQSRWWRRQICRMQGWSAHPWGVLEPCRRWFRPVRWRALSHWWASPIPSQRSWPFHQNSGGCLVFSDQGGQCPVSASSIVQQQYLVVHACLCIGTESLISFLLRFCPILQVHCNWSDIDCFIDVCLYKVRMPWSFWAYGATD